MFGIDSGEALMFDIDEARSILMFGIGEARSILMFEIDEALCSI
jgi:hypothetical protein